MRLEVLVFLEPIRRDMVQSEESEDVFVGVQNVPEHVTGALPQLLLGALEPTRLYDPFVVSRQSGDGAVGCKKGIVGEQLAKDRGCNWGWELERICIPGSFSIIGIKGRTEEASGWNRTKLVVCIVSLKFRKQCYFSLYQ